MWILTPSDLHTIVLNFNKKKHLKIDFDASMPPSARTKNNHLIPVNYMYNWSNKKKNKRKSSISVYSKDQKASVHRLGDIFNGTSLFTQSFENLLTNGFLISERHNVYSRPEFCRTLDFIIKLAQEKKHSSFNILLAPNVPMYSNNASLMLEYMQAYINTEYVYVMDDILRYIAMFKTRIQILEYTSKAKNTNNIAILCIDHMLSNESLFKNAIHNLYLDYLLPHLLKVNLLGKSLNELLDYQTYLFKNLQAYKYFFELAATHIRFRLSNNNMSNLLQIKNKLSSTSAYTELASNVITEYTKCLADLNYRKIRKHSILIVHAKNSNLLTTNRLLKFSLSCHELKHILDPDVLSFYDSSQDVYMHAYNKETLVCIFPKCNVALADDCLRTKISNTIAYVYNNKILNSNYPYIK